MTESPEEEARIGVELTPNPHSLKFVTAKDILDFGSVDFPDRETAQGSPLPARLFEIPEVTRIMIGKDFVTVSKDPAAAWEPLVPKIFEILKSSLESPGPWIREDRVPKSTGLSGTEIERRIQEVLDQEIRPAVARDGGDILYGGYEDGVVKLYLQGACSSCPSSLMTLKMGVETRLKQLIPEIREVIQL